MGDRVRTLREQGGLTQADLSAAVGTSRTHLTNIERGKDLPGRELLVALSDYFGVSLDWLSQAKGDPRPACALNQDEALLLYAFRQLPEPEAKAMLSYMLVRVKRDDS